MTDTLILAALLIPSLVIAIVFHEVAHGWTARLLGDPTAHALGRLSLNPVRHVDPMGTIIVPGALALAGLPVFGWAKPVPVIKERLRNPRFGMMAVAAAGPGTNILLALLGALVLGLAIRLGLSPEMAMSELALQAMFYFISINVFLALFNMLPIPPFDGSHIVEGLLPAGAARIYAKARHLGFALVFLVLLVIPWALALLGLPPLGVVERFVLPPVDFVQGHFLRLAAWIAGG